MFKIFKAIFPPFKFNQGFYKNYYRIPGSINDSIKSLVQSNRNRNAFKRFLKELEYSNSLVSYRALGLEGQHHRYIIILFLNLSWSKELDIVTPWLESCYLFVQFSVPELSAQI